MFIISVFELLEIAVRIIENEKEIILIPFQPKITSELLERLHYWSGYGIQNVFQVY